MASFAALGYTLAAGTVFSSLTISVFGIAVRNQQDAVAPRCAARPKETIYCAKPTDKDQDRGNPWFGWIAWTLRWSYETLLRGIPGTGTRKNGLEGFMLRMNLDAIIFLRFNALCLRISSFTAILVILVILPANWTGNPDNTLSTFNRTTLANIPPLHENHHNITTDDMFTPDILFQKLFVNLKSEMPIQARLYAIVLCSWIVTYFMCFEISKEWKDNLLLRRKYYFEADHYKKEKDGRQTKYPDKVDYISKRDPWVPNPEGYHTVPNIGLYSLLMGDVPKLPEELRDEGYTEQQELDWQTAAVTTFFDNCVPNQQGFTSSIAAITILPTSKNLNKAWKEWNKAAYALKHLRCIMSVIAERRSTERRPLPEETGQNRSDLLRKTKRDSNARNIFENVTSIQNMSSEQKRLMLAECDDDVECQFMDALQFGPQQKAIYGREFAQASKSIFGNYLLLRKYQHATYEELAEFEIDALLKLEEANKSLKKAQMANVQKQPKKTILQDGLLTTFRGSELIGNVLSSHVGNIEFDEDDDDDDINPIIENEFSALKCRMSGEWTTPSSRRCVECLCLNLRKILCERPIEMVALRDCSTYVIVTFTNRQAAVAARQCLADGRGGKHWNELKDIPTPPLADAPPFSLRGRDVLRPVTITIPKQHKVLRNWMKILLLILINLFYTIPLTALSSLSNGTHLSSIFQDSEWIKNNHDTSMDGLIYALLYTLFVSLCPYMFEFLACWCSNASSLSTAELAAMKYYWLFILVTSFVGVNITNSILAAMKVEQTSSLLYDIMKSAADTIPVSISFNWLNIIIKNTTFTMPFFYLLQTHCSFFALFGYKNVGGHSYAIAGSPLPYRAYIDCGTVLLCAVSLAFASPLVAPFAAFFFLCSEPIMRRSFIYVYLPEFDGGGFRWPFLSEMCYSSMIVGQVILLIMISFKRAIGPAMLSFITIIPTIMFRKLTHARYYQAYIDTSLLQTASLDMCNSSKNASLKERQSFRNFLVDAHKAAYIPVCIAGSATSMLTAEPAVAISTDLDTDYENHPPSVSTLPCKQRGISHGL